MPAANKSPKRIQVGGRRRDEGCEGWGWGAASGGDTERWVCGVIGMCNMGMWDVERWDFGVCGDGDAGCGVQETWDTVCWGHGMWSDGDMGQELEGMWDMA